MNAISRFRPLHRWRGSVWGLVGLLLAWPIPALAQTELAEPSPSPEPAQVIAEEAMLLGEIPSVSGAAKYEQKIMKLRLRSRSLRPIRLRNMAIEHSPKSSRAPPVYSPPMTGTTIMSASVASTGLEITTAGCCCSSIATG